MVVPSAGEVILVPFPFSDLSRAKLRPAICLASVGRGDWVLCQVTSNSYGDPLALPIGEADFAVGGLRLASFARPGKFRAYGEVRRCAVATVFRSRNGGGRFLVPTSGL